MLLLKEREHKLIWYSTSDKRQEFNNETGRLLFELRTSLNSDRVAVARLPTSNDSP